MNILLFVLAIISALTITTYGKMEEYHHYKIFRDLYQEWMGQSARIALNDQAETMYQRAREVTLGARGKGLLSPKLNLRALTTKGAEGEATAAILKQLLQVVYQKPLGYEEEQIDKIIDTLINLPTLKNNTQLEKIAFTDPELQEVWFHLLKGATPTFPPLLDFVDAASTKQLSIYRARRPLLLALFQDELFVETLIEERLNLYNLLKRKKVSPQEASVLFAKLCSERLDTTLLSLVTFDLSLTPPTTW